MKQESKLVLVTGAANGIGLAITNFLIEKGDRVIATDIDKEALNKLSNIEGIFPVFMDVTDSKSIRDAVKTIEEAHDGLDGLVNNAGLFYGGPLVEFDEKDMEKIIAVNILGVFKVTKEFFPLLHKKKGRVVNIGSETGRFSFPLNGPYTMTKFALEAFSDSLRREIMFLDMKVVHIQAGAINTPLLDHTTRCYEACLENKQSLFKNLLQIVIKTCKKEMNKGASPRHMAKAVYKGLHKKHPRVRYRVKNNKTRRLLEFLPTVLVDKAMKKVLK